LADERTVDPAFIFVYGALMRGFDLHPHMAGATFVGEATMPGRLVAVGRYPGVLDGDGTVVGELYRLDDVATSLETLDDIEDFDPADPDKSEYLRVVRDVSCKDGSNVSAWVYLYNGDASAALAVKSGDWRQHL
jgi:gamma-glutamylcyclotransferase (GGCT)/AIG2-like uncharacterized protein YtfP